MQKGIQYFREVAVLQVVCNANGEQLPTDPDEVMHTSHGGKVSTECTTVVCLLIGNNILERWARTNSGLSAQCSSDTRETSRPLSLNHGVTVPGLPSI